MYLKCEEYLCITICRMCFFDKFSFIYVVCSNLMTRHW